MTPLDRKRDQAGGQCSASRAAAAAAAAASAVKNKAEGSFVKNKVSVLFTLISAPFFFKHTEFSVGPNVDWTNQHPLGERGRGYSQGSVNASKKVLPLMCQNKVKMAVSLIAFTSLGYLDCLFRQKVTFKLRCQVNDFPALGFPHIHCSSRENKKNLPQCHQHIHSKKAYKKPLY